LACSELKLGIGVFFLARFELKLGIRDVGRWLLCLSSWLSSALGSIAMTVWEKKKKEQQ
jgi:hypothetical protein